MKRKLTYYECKVFDRANGILDTCLLSRRGYAWKDTDSGRALLFILEDKNPSRCALEKAVDSMNIAFRKAKCSKTKTVYSHEGNAEWCVAIRIDIQAKEADK